MSNTSLDDLVTKAAEIIACSNSLVVLTGAGVSKESGIPTFRDAQTGLWANYNPEDLATMEGFLTNPSMVWDWYDFRRNKVWDSKPNPGHIGLAQLEKKFNLQGKRFTLVTQNVDNLHEEAGSDNVYHLHGSIFQYKRLDDNTAFNLESLNEEQRKESPPKCPETGSLIRPNVVWFGEMLPTDVLEDSFDAAHHADVMLVIGTSGLVHPAASIPGIARQSSATIIEINPEPSALTPQVTDIYLQGTSGMIVPKVLAEIVL